MIGEKASDLIKASWPTGREDAAEKKQTNGKKKKHSFADL